jgi:uncharacterized protein YceH (UPF0502 family)
VSDEDTQKLLAAIEDTRRHFDVSSEATRHEIRLVAEGLVNLGERVSREIGRLDEKMDQGFANTQAMIRFSHAELDKRVRTMEDEISDLRSRVDRLEAAVH